MDGHNAYIRPSLLAREVGVSAPAIYKQMRQGKIAWEWVMGRKVIPTREAERVALKYRERANRNGATAL